MYKVFYITPKHTNLMNEIKFINNKNKPVKIAIGLYNSKKPICSDKDLSEEEKYMYRGREHGLEVPILEDDHEYSYIYILYEDNTIQIARYGSTEVESPYCREDILAYYDDIISYDKFIDIDFDPDFQHKSLIIDIFEEFGIYKLVFKEDVGIIYT